MSESPLSRKYIDGIYVPVALLIVGCLIVKREYTIYAAALGLLFGTVKFFNLRKSRRIASDSKSIVILLTRSSTLRA